ncbi:MAG: hypothetical protein PHR45_03405 [Muribaculaceae bacterium]|nr:hypothetical protein [Muribaculaceae bacterium]
MKKKFKILIIVGAVILVGAIGYLIYSSMTLQQEMAETKLKNEQLKIENEQLSLAGEYEQLNTEFQNYENQSKYLTNDSLIAKYGEAKDKVEKLLVELKTQKITSEKRIKELQGEIQTLKGIMRHYVEQIEALGKENEGLKAENQEIKTENQKLSTKVTEVAKKNEVLAEKMTLAEKLNLTGLNLTPIKSNGKIEKKIAKAKQLMVTFTIPQNNSTPVGEKVLYIRITSPEGSLLGNKGTFSFEGGKIPYTERKAIEYTGEEIAGIKVYWNINTALTTGQYRVEVFADNFRIASRNFSIEK